MLIVENLLSEELLGTIDRVIEKADFVDGSRTAHGNAAAAKNNLQLNRRTRDSALADLIRDMDKSIANSITSNEEVRRSAWPRVILSPPLISRYLEGMEYGVHTDIPVMGGARAIRVDLSCTIFLSKADSYDGGELVLVAPEGERSYKLERGSAIVYATHHSHRVAKVTRGERLAVVLFMQSRVPDAGKRSILHDLGMAQRAMADLEPDGEAMETLTRGYYNLVRLWTQM